MYFALWKVPFKVSALAIAAFGVTNYDKGFFLFYDHFIKHVTIYLSCLVPSVINTCIFGLKTKNLLIHPYRAIQKSAFNDNVLLFDCCSNFQAK